MVRLKFISINITPGKCVPVWDCSGNIAQNLPGVEVTSHDNDRFEVVTEDTIREMVKYGVVKNTIKNTETWIQVLKEYRSSINLDYDISTITNAKQLEHELLQNKQVPNYKQMIMKIMINL
ncbi:29324_t:CDS:2 [Gigaspora margarita]|uniref:29324_t:CDS:1 n=1 Tax=Gigaspora margarita TaxID=4874 RepID=A0ABN7V8T6_GIGMA|nr:29324_t:CDS:2 [Gigaspora margarita]